MAWNQPSGPNNPWGRRPGQGGPDLDERLKSWQRRLESLLRPGGRGGEGGSLFLMGILVVLGLWLWSGFYQVAQAERGIIQRFGRLVDVKAPGVGWRWPWPIETVTKVNVASVNSSDFKSRVLTSDVNLAMVDLHFAVQYQFSDPVKKLFRVRDPETTLSEVSESAIREIVGRSTLDELLVGSTRPEVTRRTKELIQHTLDYYTSGITVTTVNLEDVQVPDAVIPSQRDANKAQADKERFILESEAYANGIVPVAQGAALRIQQDAQAYKAQVTALAAGQASRFAQLEAAYTQSPDVTRRRLYMDSVENVLSRAHKVLIDSRAGGSMFYLPIDKLLEKGAAREAEPTGAEARRRQRDEGARVGHGRSARAGRALMSSRLFPLFIGAGVLLVLAALSLFSVSETEFAIRTEFGKIVGIDYTPGLHLKWPWDMVTKFDRRILSESYTGETFLTNDGRGLIVDFYVKWRVKDPATYYNAAAGSEAIAGQRLAEIVKDGIKSVVAQRTLQQIVSAERAAVTNQMFGAASHNAEGLGVDLVDVRVQRIDLPDEVAARVYESMKQNFAKIASRLRAEGQKASAGIRAAAERQRTVILADAERDALRIRGEGDAASSQTYARAYTKDPEFYAFYRSLQAYEHSLGKEGDLLVVTPDGEFFKYLKDPSKAPAPRR